MLRPCCVTEKISKSRAQRASKPALWLCEALTEWRVHKLQASKPVVQHRVDQLDAIKEDGLSLTCVGA